MQRKLPEKPTGLTTVEEWNNFAWKVAQVKIAKDSRVISMQARSFIFYFK